MLLAGDLMCGRLRGIVLLAGLIGGMASARGQTSAQAGAKQPGYTLHTSARIVLTDVTVTDGKGNPVHGLSRSAFHIFDNNRQEELESFQEHRGAQNGSGAYAAAPAGVFSNEYLLHPPAVSNVIMLDTTNLAIVDQMFLYQQLTKFVKAEPAGEPLAIYYRGGDFTLLLQNFTSDHALLLAAIRKAIPRLPLPDALYANDFDTLDQIVLYLSQLPGRKNVLWFSGGSNLWIQPDASTLSPEYDLRPVYDKLEASRIAIYPIDARGLMVATNLMIPAQHGMMRDVAEATGGQAFYDNNGLAKITAKILAADTSFYTLTYAPHDLHFDNTWHKVKVKVDGGSYQLSYRRGYYDDGANAAPVPQKARTRLEANGEKTELPSTRSEPIIFEASVLPTPMRGEAGGVSRKSNASAVAAPKRGETAYLVHYTMPANAFVQQNVDGQSCISMGAAILAFNELGRTIGRLSQKVTIAIDAEKFGKSPDGTVSFDQRINLAHGEDYLLLAVWDMSTGRMGTIQLPLNVAKRKDIGP